MTSIVIYYLIIILLIFSNVLYLIKRAANFKNLLLPFLFTSFLTATLAYYLFNIYLRKAALSFIHPEYSYFQFPLSEIAFAITIVILVIGSRQYIRANEAESNLIMPRKSFLALAFLFLMPSIIHHSKLITYSITLFTSASLFITSLFFSKQLRKKSFWLTVIYAYPFVALLDFLKFMLLSIEDSEGVTLNVSILSFPVEFLLYDFSIILLATSFYFYFLRRTVSLKKG